MLAASRLELIILYFSPIILFCNSREISLLFSQKYRQQRKIKEDIPWTK